MADHLTPEILAGYRTGALAPDDMLAADDHLAECARCRTRAADLPGVAESVAALAATLARDGAAEHCSYETLEAHVDGRLDPSAAEQVLAHVADCLACSEDLGDLRQARALLQVETAAAPGDNGFSAVIASMFRPRWARAAAAVAIAAVMLWLVVRPGSVPPAPEIAGNHTAAPSPAAPPPSNEAPAAATLRDAAGVVVLTREGELTGVAEGSPPLRSALIAALESGRIVVATSTTGLASALRSPEASEAFRVVEPVGRTVEEQRPTFRWTALAGATRYRVDVYDPSYTLVTSSPELSSTEWTPPSPLRRGRTYVWQVTAMTPAGGVLAPQPPAPEARVAILGDELASEIARARQEAPPSHLVLAVLYARAGMRHEAERELDALVELNPNSTLARDLRASVAANRQ